MRSTRNIYDLKKYRRKLRNNATPPEVIFWGIVRNKQMGVKFRRQYSVGYYILDFYCPSLKLNVEIDGVYHEGRVEEDFKRDVFLNECGIKVIRFSAYEVFQNIEGVSDNIYGIVQSMLIDKGLIDSNGYDIS